MRITQTSIFDPYPRSPGYRMTDTSRTAAKAVRSKAATLREQCLSQIQLGEFTADEIADSLEESILTIRPRITELNKQGVIVDTGKRRKNQSGKLAIVWRSK